MEDIQEIAIKFNEWQKKHPDEGYQYDEIHDFISELSRGDLLEVMEYVRDKFVPQD